MKQVLLKIRELIDTYELIDAESSRVRFIDFGEYAQELEFFSYIKTKDFAEYLEHRENINLNIIDIIESVGASLTVPVKTINLNQAPEQSITSPST